MGVQSKYYQQDIQAQRDTQQFTNIGGRRKSPKYWNNSGIRKVWIHRYLDLLEVVLRIEDRRGRDRDGAGEVGKRE